MWNQAWTNVGAAMPPLPTQTIEQQPPLPSAPPPTEPAPSTALPSTMIAPTAMTNPFGQYTAAQYAALTTEQQYALQQHWQQWQIYQQEYAKWHAQYGEQYNREMAAYQQPPLPTQPPPLPPNEATVAPPLPDGNPENPVAPSALDQPTSVKSSVKITAAATIYNSAQQAAQILKQQVTPWCATGNRVDYSPSGPNQQPPSLLQIQVNPPFDKQDNQIPQNKKSNSWSQRNPGPAQSNNNQKNQNKFMNSENFGHNSNLNTRNNFSNPNDENWNQGGRNNTNFNETSRDDFTQDNYLDDDAMVDFGAEGRSGGGFNANNQRNAPGGPQNQNNQNQWQGNRGGPFNDRRSQNSNNNNNKMGNQNRWGNNPYNSNNNMRNFDSTQDEQQNRNYFNEREGNLNRGPNNGGNFNQGLNERGDMFNRGPNPRGNFNQGSNESGGYFNRGPNDGGNFNQGSKGRGGNFNRGLNDGGNFNQCSNNRGGNFNRGLNDRGNFNQGSNSRGGNFNRGPNDEGNFNQGSIDRGRNFNRGPNDGGNFNQGSNDRGRNFNRSPNDGGNFNQGLNDSGGNFNREKGDNFNRNPNDRRNFNQGPNEGGYGLNEAANNKNQPMKPDLTEEIFDREFRAWEEQFDDWKRTNANHPDRIWYNRILEQFETQRKILIEKRNQMRQRRMAQVGGQPQQLSPHKFATQQVSEKEHQNMPEENKQNQAEQKEELENKPQPEQEAQNQKEHQETENDETKTNQPQNIDEKETASTVQAHAESSTEERKRKMSDSEEDVCKNKSLRTDENEEEHIITISLIDDENVEANEKMRSIFEKSEGIPGLDLVEGENNLFAPKDNTEKEQENKESDKQPQTLEKVSEPQALETKEETQKVQTSTEVGEPKKPLAQQIQESSVGKLPIVLNALQDPEMLQNIIQVLAKVQGLNQQGEAPPEPTEQLLQQLPGLLQKLQDQRQQPTGNQGDMPFEDCQQQHKPSEGREKNFSQMNLGLAQFRNSGGSGPANNFEPIRPQCNVGPVGNFEQMRPQANVGPMGNFGQIGLQGNVGPMGNFGSMAPQGNLPHIGQPRNFGFSGPGGQRDDMSGSGPNFDRNRAQNFRGNGNSFNNRKGGPGGPGGQGFGPNFGRQSGAQYNNMGGSGGCPPNRNAQDANNSFGGNKPQGQNKNNPFRNNPGPRGAGSQGNQWQSANNSADGGSCFADDEYFEPVKVIDYQNSSTAAKVIDYSRRVQPNIFQENSRRTIPDDFKPVKTFDYGHASGAIPFGRRRAESASSGGVGGGNNNNNMDTPGGPSNGPPNRFGKNNRKNKRRNKKNKNKNQQMKQPQHDQSQQQLQQEEETLVEDNEGKQNISDITDSTVENAENENVQNPAMEDTETEMITHETVEENKLQTEDLSTEENFEQADEKTNSENFEEDFEEISENEEMMIQEEEKGNNSPTAPPPPIFSMGALPKRALFPAASSINIETTAKPNPMQNKIQLFYPSVENNNTITIDEILLNPGRLTRPKKICIILRGPPGSGKSYVAKLIKEKEQEMGGNSIRILSIDDYFLIENDYEEKCPKTGKNIKKKEILYEYDEKNEPTYMQYLIKSFKKTITDNFYDIIIIDCNNNSLRTLNEFYCPAKDSGFMAYIVDLFCDLEVCLNRNVHERSEKDIREIIDTWKPTPFHYIKLDVSSLLENVVDMEDADNMPTDDVGSVTDLTQDETNIEDAQNSSNIKENTVEVVDEDDSQGSDKTCGFLKSKWESEENQMEQLARLDGTRKVIKRDTTMEDYLQSDDWLPAAASTPGKKRVRWADIEEKRKQQKMRDIGFVVGQTDWRRMMDPQAGNRALNQTKYFRKNK